MWLTPSRSLMIVLMRRERVGPAPLLRGQLLRDLLRRAEQRRTDLRHGGVGEARFRADDGERREDPFVRGEDRRGQRRDPERALAAARAVPRPAAPRITASAIASTPGPRR